MTSFELSDSGCAYGSATEKALAFAQGDKTRLAEVAFARFLSERGIVYEWATEPPFRVCYCGWQTYGIRVVSSEDELVEPVEGVDSTLVVLITDTDPPMIGLLGTNASHREPFAARNVCRMADRFRPLPVLPERKAEAA